MTTDKQSVHSYRTENEVPKQFIINVNNNNNNSNTHNNNIIISHDYEDTAAAFKVWRKKH